MNVLVLGSDKTDTLTEIVNDLREPYLLIHRGEITPTIPKRRKVTYFDYRQHSLDILKHITYIRALDFISAEWKAIPGGPTTLTKDYSQTATLAWLLDKPTSFYEFPRASREVLGSADAENKIKRILLSPVLSRVLTNPTNFSLHGIVVVRLNRAELGDFDCLMLGNLLASMYEGQVIITDYGFYGHNTTLITQDRLIAGLNYLDETPLKNDLLLIKEKIPVHCLPEDAEVLAQHAGLILHTDGATTYIQQAIK